ncbi:MAG: endonuclease NucS [Candidatus Altiarchaeales archaeon ex4484_2]|nr:MAG: endonuclease NucS [Candidatus Altiarchaeales archaeon ex4484_2]
MKPSPNADLCNQLNRDLEERKLIQIVCSCSIEYDGRSKSSIGEGHRIIIIKPDSTLLIHSISGFKPVNWMRAPTETIAEYVKRGGEEIILRSGRTKKPYEDLSVHIYEVLDHRTYSNLQDREALDLRHTEKDLQDHLVRNPKLVHPEFRLKSREYQSPLGFFDLYGKIGDSYVVVELKVERAGLPAALQIKRYRDWLQQHMENSGGILVAPSITPNARILLRKENIEFKKIRVQDLEMERKRTKKLSEWC